MKRLLGLAVAALILTVPSPATAGTYQVKACYSPPGGGWVGNGSWAAEVTSGWATAYTSCPDEGIVTRMSGGPGQAPYGAGARHSFTAPPGTRVVRFQGNVYVNATRGWYAGFLDSSPSWIWCSNACTTWGTYQWIEFGANTPQLFAQVTCGSFAGCSRAAQYGILAMRDVIVTVQDDGAPWVSITGGSVTAGGWRSGAQNVRYSAGDTSGIRAVEVFVDGVKRGGHLGRCSEVSSRPCDDWSDAFGLAAENFPVDGRHAIVVKAFDGAWNSREIVQHVLIDRTAPAQPLDGRLVASDGWRSQNRFTVQWRNPPQTAAPISAVRYTICPAANRAGDARGCMQGSYRARNLAALADLKVPGPGDWRITFWLEDEAGNADPERSVTLPGLRFDETPPSVAFAPPTESDPTRVRVVATDVTSGVGSGQIEARRKGEDAWRSLPTTLGGNGFSAVLDDELLPRGEYELRARAIDLAGNERSTQSLQDGRLATRELPLRIRTRLAVGKRKRVRANGSRGKRRYRTVLLVKPRARYGRTIPLNGRLTTPGANPLARTGVEVWEQVKLPAAEWRRIGLVQTSRTGRFRFKALRGPSRVLRFRYPGTATIRARSTHVELRVRAVTSFKVNRRRVVNGEEIRFYGRLKGRQTGAAGKLLHLQVFTRGRWSTFATPRANRANGRWSQPYRFTATRGRVGYRFRALVPREASFPYETGASRSRRVTVQGL